MRINFSEKACRLYYREMIEFSDKFMWMKMFVSDHIPHELSKEMSQKSTPFLFPILMKNKTSYSDCIGILTSYCSQLEDRYARAGRGSHAIFMSLELKLWYSLHHVSLTSCTCTKLSEADTCKSF